MFTCSILFLIHFRDNLTNRYPKTKDRIDMTIESQKTAASTKGISWPLITINCSFKPIIKPTTA